MRFVEDNFPPPPPLHKKIQLDKKQHFEKIRRDGKNKKSDVFWIMASHEIWLENKIATENNWAEMTSDTPAPVGPILQTMAMESVTFEFTNVIAMSQYQRVNIARLYVSWVLVFF